jgi:hypothetical protein
MPEIEVAALLNRLKPSMSFVRDFICDALGLGAAAHCCAAAPEEPYVRL